MNTAAYRKPVLAFVKSNGPWALVSRMFVYLSGFSAVFLLSANTTPAMFGEYSLYQSAIELGLIIGTLGSSIVFSRYAAMVPAIIFVGDVRQTLLIGTPIAILLVASILLIQRLPLSVFGAACVTSSLVLFSFNALYLAYMRGRGRAGLLNLEAGLRSTMLILGILLATWCGYALTVDYMLFVNAAAIALISACIFTLGKAGPMLPSGPPGLKVGTQIGATAYSLLTFSLRKADLLIIALFMPLTYVGSFKLAFLLAEAPSQFVIAFLYTNTRSMLEVRRNGHDYDALRLARMSLALGTALFLCLGIFLYIASDMLKFRAEARTIFFYMLPYFYLRTYTVHHEMLLQLNTRLRSLGYWTAAEFCIKLVVYGYFILVVHDKPHYIFPVMALVEFLLMEIRVNILLGYWPCLRIWRDLGLAGAGWFRN